MSHREAYGLVTDFDPLHRIETDTLALADAAEQHLEAPVAGCPGWTVADLVRHVLEVQHFWGAVVAGRVQDPAEVAGPARPEDAHLVPELRAGVARLVAALRGADPTEPVYTWAPRKDAGFVVRHQVQEAAVHRWDAETAAGRDVPLDPAAATDGIEEFLQYSTPHRAQDAQPLGGALVLAAVDTGLGWSVEEDDDGALSWHRIERGADEYTAVLLSATASDLLLYLYRRRGAADLSVTGDVAVAERFALRNPTS